MAAMIASPVSKLLSNLRSFRIRSSAAAAAAAVRSFSTEIREAPKTLDVDRRADDSPVPARRGGGGGGDLFSGFLFDALSPFSPARSLSQVLNLMDRMLERPLAAAGMGMRLGWDAREDEEALHLRIDMPGLGKEDVSVTLEQNTLVIKGEGGEEDGEGEAEEGGRPGRRRYGSRIDLPPNLYKLDGIRAEMKNGVLKVVVPKVKDEERRTWSRSRSSERRVSVCYFSRYAKLHRFCST